MAFIKKKTLKGKLFFSSKNIVCFIPCTTGSSVVVLAGVLGGDLGGLGGSMSLCSVGRSAADTPNIWLYTKFN